jgi:hypothetical protein
MWSGKFLGARNRDLILVMSFGARATTKVIHRERLSRNGKRLEKIEVNQKILALSVEYRKHMGAQSSDVGMMVVAHFLDEIATEISAAANSLAELEETICKLNDIMEGGGSHDA